MRDHVDRPPTPQTEPDEEGNVVYGNDDRSSGKPKFGAVAAAEVAPKHMAVATNTRAEQLGAVNTVCAVLPAGRHRDEVLAALFQPVGRPVRPEGTVWQANEAKRKDAGYAQTPTREQAQRERRARESERRVEAAQRADEAVRIARETRGVAEVAE